MECQWEAPGNGTTNKGQTIINPIDETKAEDIHHHLKNDQLTTPFQLRRLGLPDRRSRGIDTIADTVVDHTLI